MNQNIPFHFITTPFELQDAYKLSHWDMPPDDTTGIYSNGTPRKSRRAGIDKFVLFGVQAFLKDLNAVFDNLFFNLSEDEAVENFDNFYFSYFGTHNESSNEHVRSLHKLGYLPVRIKALPEGSVTNYNIPVFTICSTHDDFYWFEQWLETWFSCSIWKPCTSATTALYYRKIFNKYNSLTSDIDWIVDFQAHGFEMRGMSNINDSAATGAAHLLSFKGEDTCVALPWVNYYYSGDNGLVCTSVPASEHSVQTAFLQAGSFDTLQCDREYLQNIIDKYPTGIVSIVADGYDYWRFIDVLLPEFKDQIMARDGKLVIRPDSSPKTPVEMIVGDPEAAEGTSENKGTVQRLYEIFGGTVNNKGYIDLDPHISNIYGDSITLPYAEAILEGLMNKGFSSNNIVLGVGSGTYQGNGSGLHGESSGSWGISRDTTTFAIKATAIASARGKDQVWRAMFKDPKTDNSGKKSARGFLKLTQSETGEYILHQDVSLEDEATGCLEVVYEDGVIKRHQSFADVRETLNRYHIRT